MYNGDMNILLDIIHQQGSEHMKDSMIPYEKSIISNRDLYL